VASEIDRIIDVFNKRPNVPQNSRVCFESGIAYLKGKEALEKQKKEELEKAIEHFRCSVEACPTPEGYNLLGTSYYLLGDYEKALKNFEESLELYKWENNLEGEGTTLNNISQIYYSRGDYDTALEYLNKSLKIRQEIGDKSGEGKTLNNISQIYYSHGDNDTSLEYLNK